MSLNEYQVKTLTFEGPFNLLLNLVQEKKLFINEISLAAVTEDYLKHINNLENLLPGQISNFITVAATLILIKSKSLLPNLNLTADEEKDIQDLEDRLQLYEQYLTLSEKIKKQFGRKIIFYPEEKKKNFICFSPDSKINPENMLDLINEILNKIPVKKLLPEIEVKKVISIEEMIDQLTERIQNSIKVNFKDFGGKIQTKEEKVFVIVGFLAVLELIRNGILKAVQENNFDDIIIEKEEILLESL